MNGPTEKSRKTNLETNNIGSCRPVQYEQKRITQNQENGQEKRFFTHIDRVNMRNEAETI